MQARTLLRGGLVTLAALAAIAAVTLARRSGPSDRAPGTVTILARDFAFDAPARVPAGVTSIRLVNQGKEPHHVWLVRLAPGQTAAGFVESVKTGRMPQGIVNLGGPNLNIPGGEASATVDLMPGHYAIVCFIPSPDGVPHLMKGMERDLEVAGPDAGAALPRADLTLDLADYAFAFSAPLTAGKHLIRVRNLAAQPHEVTLWKLAPGKTPQDVAQWVHGMVGPPPAQPIGGISGLDRGHDNLWPVEITPGEYALLCFVPDAGDGKEHVEHGMIQQLTVR